MAATDGGRDEEPGRKFSRKKILTRTPNRPPGSRRNVTTPRNSPTLDSLFFSKSLIDVAKR